MKISFGDHSVEVRPWGGAGSGKALLMTRDETIMRKTIDQMCHFPEAFEQLNDGWYAEVDDGLFMIVVDAKKIGLFFDLEFMHPGLCVCQENEEDVDYAGT